VSVLDKEVSPPGDHGLYTMSEKRREALHEGGAQTRPSRHGERDAEGQPELMDLIAVDTVNACVGNQ
jgi:hypothetical protein